MARRHECIGLVLLGVLLGALACTGGQSGNEGVTGDKPGDHSTDGGAGSGGAAAAPASDGFGDPGECDPNGPSDCEGRAPTVQPCPCGDFSGFIALHAVISAFEEGRAEVQVHRWLDGRNGCPTEDSPWGLPTPGEIVGGAYDGTLPCGSECSGLAPGDEVLALYQRGDQDGLGCSDYRECSKERCGPLPMEGDGAGDFGDELATWDVCDMECLEETRAVCAARDDEARLGGRIALATWAPEVELGGYTVSDEDAYALVGELEACEAVVTARAQTEDEPSEEDSTGSQALAPPSDASTVSCAVEEGQVELEAVEPPLCNDAGLIDLDAALHGNDEVCPAPDAGISVPIECSDVCGTLSLCSDGEVACEPCLERCAASGPSNFGGGTCLTRNVYLIDEEGCDRMLDVYRSFDAETDCEQ